MSKKWQREEREVERLERTNRELKSIVKTLQRRLKKVTKGYPVEDYEEETPKQKSPPEKICYSCQVGKLMLVDMGSRYFRSCTNCFYRTRSKVKDEKKA